MTPSPRVSVVIPHYHDLRGLDLCLAALAAQTYRGGEVEIIVADWGSVKTLREHCRLTKDAAAIVRFLMIPTPLAKEKQKDSPFAEVFAINDDGYSEVTVDEVPAQFEGAVRDAIKQCPERAIDDVTDEPSAKES